MTYQTPVRDMLFSLKHMAGFDQLIASGAYEDLSDDLVAAVLEEAGKFADNVIAPLNGPGDEHGARLANGVVTTPPGYVQTHQQFIDAGWGSLAFPSAYGGQGLPTTLALAVSDAFSGASVAFALCNILTTGAVKAMLAFGTDEQKRLYLENMISGKWTGTMNLTEGHAGSDLSTIRTKAEPIGDGRYKISGSKIFISYGEHDMAENICHLVLARLPDAPEGTRGISMFLVPKFHVNDDGTLGARNDVKCTGIEHKLGQHGSPTCSLSFGDSGACYGTLLGTENEGLKNMFVMMNAARIEVGMQGAAVSEHALQDALTFSMERKQGRAFGVKSGDSVSIIQHPDVQRNLYTMKALTAASRAMCYANMVAYDMAHVAPDEETRALYKEREELLTPLAKSFSSDRGNEVTSIGVQIHGGMGFVEETGAAQHMRDVRICTIYEGTNGIQAIDLIGRKLGMKGGKLAHDFITEVKENTAVLENSTYKDLQAMAARLMPAIADLEVNTAYMIEAMERDPQDALAGATPYQDQFGYVAGAHYLALGAQAAAKVAESAGDDAAYYTSKIGLARFYMDNILPRVHGLNASVQAGNATLEAIDPALLVG